MRTTAFLTASFALLALLVLPATALPGDAGALEADKTTNAADAVAEQIDGYEHAVVTAAAAPTLEARFPEDTAYATELVARQNFGPYNVNCAAVGGYPNVCENWCYYVFCRNAGVNSSSPLWTVTVNRTAGLRPQSECGRLNPNKCSVLSRNPWPANPLAGQDCDEQPKNTNNEGGANAATRCMAASENRGEGSAWSRYINNNAAGRIPDGTRVQVVLQNPLGPICASWRNAGTTVCPAPVTPTTPGVALDAIRQQ